MAAEELWITGMGVVSALGAGVESHLNAISAKRSGLEPAAIFGTPPDPVICGMVPQQTLPLSIDDSASDRADRLADIASREALVCAADQSCSNCETVVGTTLGNMHGGTLYYRDLRQGNGSNIGLVKNFLSCSTASNLAAEFHLQGKCITVSSACASGTTAISTAALRIMNGNCECALAVGVDALSPFVVAGFNSLRLLSKEACRPFDTRRDGLNPGEGAGALLIESSRHAVNRGAKPLARIAGFGSALEAFHYTKSDPEGKGIATAIRGALDMARIRPEDIDHIHAHGTATVINVTSEYNGFRSVFGERLCDIPVCSTKSMTGHTFGAAGAIATIFAIASITHSVIPPTLFHMEKDPVFADLTVGSEPIYKKVNRVLCVTLGFGGEAAAVIIEKL